MKKVAVIGAGTMGVGIAQACLISDYHVVVYDSFESSLIKGKDLLVKNLTKAKEKSILSPERFDAVSLAFEFNSNLESVYDADIIIEAIVENLEVKQNLFSGLSANVSESAILATNTSSLSVTAIASKTKNSGRVLGIHFFNPAYIMKLVEIIKGEWTDDSVIQKSAAFVKSLEKVPVIVKDTPGFIVNRIARPYYGEAFKILSDGIADIQTTDSIMRNIGGFKMGPFELLDLIGIDVNFDVTRSVYNAYFQDPKYRPSIIQQRMVEAGKLGVKTKNGFYSYDK